MSFNSFPLSYASNPLSLRVQDNLQKSSNSLSRSYERLSSGLRINSPSDDAAGYALATSVKTQQKLSDVAIRNINDGIAVVSIAQSGLQQQSNILTRLTELASIAAGGMLSTSQQSATAAEYRALVSEFGRIGKTATWPSLPNDISLLAAGRGTNQTSISVQAGIGGDASSRISLGLADTSEYGGVLNRNSLLDWTGITRDDANVATLGTRYSNQLMSFSVLDSSNTARTILAGVATNGTTLYFDFYIENAASGTPPASADQWDYRSYGSTTYDASGSFADPTFQASISGFSGGASASISIDLRGLKMSSTTGATVPNYGDTSALEFTGVETSGRATAASAIIQRRQETVSAAMASFNASGARLDQAVQYMSVERENFGAAYNAITSVDVAEEVANMVAEQIRQLGGQSVLAQANLQPQVAYNLLKGTLSMKKAA